ncbi:flippase-like domain-containing protein, partial [Methanobrevibacter sp.]|uniref:flippase-like domain-containing protein n=1 Tax=Methanobrevibacter sp. TaxID=66852 RepID=UPI00386F2656
LISNKKGLVYTLTLSFIIWIFEIFRVYLVFLAFGANVNPIIIGEVFIVACLVGMIPLLPGGLGAVDGLMILFYSAAGVSASVSAAATVIERLISFWMATIIGMILMPYYGSSVLDKISSGSSNEKLEERPDDEYE